MTIFLDTHEHDYIGSVYYIKNIMLNRGCKNLNIIYLKI